LSGTTTLTKVLLPGQSENLKMPDISAELSILVTAGQSASSSKKKGKRAAPLLQAIDREWEEWICSGLSNEDTQTLTSLMRTVAENGHRILQNVGDNHATGE